MLQNPRQFWLSSRTPYINRSPLSSHIDFLCAAVRQQKPRISKFPILYTSVPFFAPGPEMESSPLETRDRYCYWVFIPTRWMDGDPYGHVNNAQYYSFVDTAVTSMLIDKGVLHGPRSNSIGLCVESGCRFLAPVSFPGTIEAGVRIARVGNSSLRYEVGLFKSGDTQPVAAAYFVHVFVDPETRRPVPLSEEVKASMCALTLDA